MNFLTPAAFVFAATLPVVVLFYLLKRKRVVKRVSSTLLWQKYLAETQASAPFQKLRRNWLLLLQLLMLTMAILALARPFFARNARSGGLQVVILDASASMQSTDESPSRFEQARAAALRGVDSLRDADQMVVLVAAAVTKVKQSATSEKAVLRRALQGAVVTDGPTRLSEALKMAETLVRNQPNAEIHLYSDGAVPDLIGFENQNLPLVYHQVGRRGNNVGIVSLDVRANPDDPSQRALFTSIANHFTNDVATQIELRFDQRIVEVRSLTLKARETLPLVFLAGQTNDGVFTVRLDVTDELAADNQASIVSLVPQPERVLLITRGNRFLEKALKAAANVQLSVAADLTEASPAADVVVLDDVAPTVWPDKNVLAIHTARTNWFTGLARLETPAIVDWAHAHPLLRFVTFDNVQVAESLAVKTPSWATALVESPTSPLLLAGELGRQRVVWIGFDTLQSTWPLRISFPIFAANAMDWLNPAASGAQQLLVRAGDPFRLGLPQPVTSAQITLPGGEVRPLPIDVSAREIVFGDTDRAGIYRLRTGTNETVFCVNALDAAESDTTPRAELPLGKYARVAATTLRPANLELWRWIAAVGLGVLLFEWWYYHRRTA